MGKLKSIFKSFAGGIIVREKAWKIINILVVSFLLIAFAVTESSAINISIQLNYNDFGHLKNDGPLCAPTATINSFMYLRNRYSDVYKNTELLTDYNGGGIGLTDLAKDRNMLANGWHNRAGTGGCGASAQSWWEGKVYWIEDWAPNTTTFDGMVKVAGNDPKKWHSGDVLENAFPTWDFLWSELSHGEDVELGFNYADGAHAVTLTSLKFDDQNNNKRFDIGESRKIDYLDPNNPSKLFQSDLYLLHDGSLGFNWDNGGAATNVSIFLAYAESPVPEPSTYLVLLSGLLILIFYNRRVRKSIR